MTYKHTLPLLGLLSALPFAGLAPAYAAPPPVCAEADMADLPKPGTLSFNESDNPATPVKENTLRALFKPPVLEYPYESLDVYGFYLRLIVGIDGRVECATIKPKYGAKSPPLNEVRTRFLEQASLWRFEPYRIKGKIQKATLEFSIDEEERPQSHVPAPAGDPELLTITQDVRPYFATYGSYHIELHGDGSAIYTSASVNDPLGPQSYKVDPKAIKALVGKAEAADFWSMRDYYRPLNNRFKRRPYQRLNITLGGKTKSLMDQFDSSSGLPSKARHLQYEVMAVANVEFWQTPSLAMLEQLKVNRFDFQSQSAASLLLQMTRNPKVIDEAILALIDLGAPQNAVEINPETDEYQNLLGAALYTGRKDLSSRLIAKGALLTKEKLNQKKIDSAFGEAVSSGKLEMVDLILPFKPAMTFSDDDDPEVQISILFKLTYADGTSEEKIAVAQRLIDLGADINTRKADGTILLHETTSDRDFTLFLLAHGANINATDNEGRTPLGNTYDEDTALMLLERGADPRLGQTAYHLRFMIKANHWTEVKAWLQSHGYADVLIAPKDEAA